MSYVTNVLLVTLEDGQPISEINQWLEDRKKGTLQLVSRAAGGTKCMECRVYAGAFNYLDTWSFVEMVNARPWRIPQCMQLLILDEGEDKFREWDWVKLHPAPVVDGSADVACDMILEFTDTKVEK